MDRSPATVLARDVARIALAILGGCTHSELATIDLSDRDAVVAFIVVVDERDGVLRITRPFGVEGGNLSFGERPQLELTAGESSAVLIELDRAALQQRHPDLALDRALELSVDRRSPPPSDVIDGSDPTRATKETAISAEGTLLTDLLEKGSFAADSARARAILSQLTLTLPSDPEYCRPTEAAFAPYGAEAALISDPRELVRSLDGVILLGRRAILRTRTALHLVDRGGAIDRSRSFETALLTDVALDPTASTGERLRLMATVMHTREPPPGDSVLIELSVTATSIEYARTPLAVDPAELESVAISSEGRTAVLEEDGGVYLEEPAGPFSVRAIDDPSDEPKARTILWTSDPAKPLIATSRNRIQVWDPIADRFTARVLVEPTEMSLHINALAAEGAEIWAGGTGGFLMRITGGAFERIVPKLPPRYLGCATTQGGISLFGDEVLDLAVRDGHVYAVLAQCSAVMAIRISDRCVSLIDVDGGEPHLLDETVDGLRAIDIFDGELLVTDAAGRALILPL